MQQSGRRGFLQLLAGAALSGTLLDALLHASESRSLTASAAKLSSPLKIGLISDLNGSYGSTRYGGTVQRGVSLLLHEQPDLVLCAGDMVAGQKTSLTDRQLAAMWAAFDQTVYSPLEAAGIPMLPAMGNHDASSQKHQGLWIYGRERQQAAQFWQQHRSDLMPEVIDADGYPFQYAWRLPGLFVVVIDASSANVDGVQRQWLGRALKSAHRRADDLCLVMGHLPLTAFSQGRARAGECIANPEGLSTQLRQASVDLVISGHHHAWYPSESLGLRLLSLGAMGSGPRRLIGAGAASPPSLTLLEWSQPGGLVSETTIDLSSMRPISVEALPGRIVVPGFAEARRRSTGWQRGSEVSAAV